MLEQIKLVIAASNSHGPRNELSVGSVRWRPRCEDQMQQSEKSNELTEFKFAMFFVSPLS